MQFQTNKWKGKVRDAEEQKRKQAAETFTTALRGSCGSFPPITVTLPPYLALLTPPKVFLYDATVSTAYKLVFLLNILQKPTE